MGGVPGEHRLCARHWLSSAASGFMRGTFSTGLFHVIEAIWDARHWYYSMDLRKIFTTVDMKHQKLSLGKGLWQFRSELQEAPASQSCRHLSKKLNICQSVKRDSGINFEASFVAVYWNYILLLYMKSENDWKLCSDSVFHSWAHKLNPRIQSICSIFLIFLQGKCWCKTSASMSGIMQRKWSEV